MTMPNFLMIGAMKAGTTSLYYYVRQHPDVYLNPTRKETQFFAYKGITPNFRGPGDDAVNHYIITELETYRQQFAGAANQLAIGEIGTVYLYERGTAARIQHYLPRVKLVAVLRNPIERAYSNFLHMAREELEPCGTFSDALAQEAERMRANWSAHWHYKQVGFYAAQLREYLQFFPRDQMRIYLYDDLAADPRAVLCDLFQFLEIDDTFAPNVSLKHNVSGAPVSHTLHNLLGTDNRVRRTMRYLIPKQYRLNIRTQLQNRNLRPPPALDAATRAELIEMYRDDILQLQDLLQRDLRHWLKA